MATALDLTRNPGAAAATDARAGAAAAEEGRRRFHGAFTGGFSAGYYNTVGSKEGWAPASFVSSRSNRAERREQTAFDFLDDDERGVLAEAALQAAPQFDTFGTTAAEVA
eukprot:SM006809S21016  [mRNA]  locus=s6809:5:812:+ [translate_table: standard]